jgi:hypothetical protein
MFLSICLGGSLVEVVRDAVDDPSGRDVQDHLGQESMHATP